MVCVMPNTFGYGPFFSVYFERRKHDVEVNPMARKKGSGKAFSEM